MKHIFLIVICISFCVSKALSTEQVPDLLITGKDTFYLKSFPLDDLIIKRIGKSPFENQEWTTATYRGYVATWRIISDSLFLTKLVSTDSTREERDTSVFLLKNDYPAIKRGNYVFADWYSAVLVRYEFFRWNFHISNRFYLWNDIVSEKPRRTELIFKNGLLVENAIIPFESYQIGDTLYRDIYYYRSWIFDHGVKTVDAVIKGKNDKMVNIEICSYGTDKKRIKKKLDDELRHRGTEYWVNPRYWESKANAP